MTNPLDISQKFYVENCKVVDVKKFDIKTFECPKIIYEVIKVIKNAPLFFAEHLDRLERSCTLANFSCPPRSYITRGVEMLLEANPVEAKNIRISLCFNEQYEPRFLCYYVESHYPAQSDYINGVKVELLEEIRRQPNVKADNPALRNTADSIIKSQGVYETLLVDHDGFITECSRSNFFAVHGNSLVTPLAQDVLEGVTRMKVIELAKQNGIECVERKVKLAELSAFDAAFITGTSRGVLPLYAVGSLKFNPHNPLTAKMMELYNRLTEKDIEMWNWNKLSSPE